MASVRLIKHNEGYCCDMHLQENRDFSVGHKSCLLYTQLVFFLVHVSPCVCATLCFCPIGKTLLINCNIICSVQD